MTVKKRKNTDDKGRFKPGNTGRPKGSKNKPNPIKAGIEAFLSGKIKDNELENIYKALEPKEKAKYLTDLMPYAIAKKKEVEQRTEHTGVVQYFEIGGKKIPFE